MKDDQLHRWLRAHPSRPSLSHGFNRSVWARIEAGDAMTCSACIRRACLKLFTWLGRPLPAMATLIAAALLGAWLGHQEVSGEDPNLGKIRYLESINPLRITLPSQQP